MIGAAGDSAYLLLMRFWFWLDAWLVSTPWACVIQEDGLLSM